MEPPRTCDLSFATDYYPMVVKNAVFYRGERRSLIFGDIGNKKKWPEKDTPHTLIHLWKGCEKGTQKLPLITFDLYWVQAPLIMNKLKDVTCYSGKIYFFTEAFKVNEVWNSLLAAHLLGYLGYGLRCRSAKKAYLDTTKTRQVTIHISNIFDLHEVSIVAWNIGMILFNINCFKSNALQVIADFSNEVSRTHGRGHPFAEPLYIISSTDFYVGKESKSRIDFMEGFVKANQDYSDRCRHLFDKCVDNQKLFN